MNFNRISVLSKNNKSTICCSVLALCTIFSAGFTDGNRNVAISVDGRTTTIETRYSSPELILNQAGIHLNHYDEYEIKKTDKAIETITVHRAVPVEISIDGKSQTIHTSQPTIGGMLDEIGYGEYQSDIDRLAPIQSGMSVKLTKEAPQPKVEEMSAISAPVVPMVNTGYGNVPYKAVYTMEATAYIPSDGGGSGITASGIPAAHGCVAVDTSVIPLGTRLFIPGYGIAIAADTGGAIYGNRVDLCMDTYGEAIAFGRRTVEVYVLS